MGIQRAYFKPTRTDELLRREPTNNNLVCRYWKKGNCQRNPCKFMHTDVVPSNVYTRFSRRSHTSSDVEPRKSPYFSTNKSLVSDTRATPIGSGTRKKRSDLSLEGRMSNSNHGPNNPLTLRTVGEKYKFHNSQNSSSDDTENLFKKFPSLRNTLLLTSEDDGSNDKSKQHSYASSTEGVGLKKTKVVESSLAPSQKCPEHGPDTSLFLTSGSAASEDKTAEKKTLEEACKLWMSGNCVQGDGCQFLHSWSRGDGFSFLTNLRGHSKAISGIALPSGSNKLYTGSADGTVCIWDCHTGQSTRVIDIGEKIGCLISEGPWVFVGIPNVVKAWNIETLADFSLSGPVGEVYAMAVALDMLFAGAQDGAISVWRGSAENPNPFQLETSLKGHAGGVISLAVGVKMLCSGSMDSTIMVWDLDTLQCLETLNGHTDAVTSMICWNEYLLSCSLDQTIKVWFAAGGNKFETIYAHKEDHRVLALCGTYDAEAKPILMCSCNDDSVHVYELPSFKERGRMFSKQVVRSIERGPDGLCFSGDDSGLLTVWKFAEAIRGGTSSS